MSFSVSGNTTRGPSDLTALATFGSVGSGGSGVQASAMYLITGLTPGNNTFTLQYRTSSIAVFPNRSITVIPF